MGADCSSCASPEPAPPPYEASGYKSSHYGPSHHAPSHHAPSHYPPPRYPIEASVTRVVPAATTRQGLTQRRVSNSTRQKVANSTQRKVENKALTPEREAAQYEVMILGLPKADGHTPHVSANLVAAALGTSVAHGDIIDAYRIPGNGRKAQPLIIKFSSIELRDKWISLKQNKKQLFAHQVHPIFGNEKVSVVERLSPEDQALFVKVQAFARKNKYRFVWARHGDIFIRKTETAKAHLIQCDGDLNNLFN